MGRGAVVGVGTRKACGAGAGGTVRGARGAGGGISDDADADIVGEEEGKGQTTISLSPDPTLHPIGTPTPQETCEIAISDSVCGIRNCDDVIFFLISVKVKKAYLKI